MEWLKHPIGCESLRRALSSIAGAIALRPGGLRGPNVLLEGRDGVLSLTTYYEGDGARAVIPDIGVEDGEVQLDHAELVDALGNRKGDVTVPNLGLTEVKRPADKVPDLDVPISVTLYGNRFKEEVTAALRAVSASANSLVYYGVRLWFERDAMLVQGCDPEYLSIVRIPATVGPKAIGRSVLIPPPIIRSYLSDLRRGDEVRIGIDRHDHGHAHRLTLSTDRLTLTIVDKDQYKVHWGDQFFSTAVASMTVDRRELQEAAATASATANWSRTDHERPVVVHLSADPVRATVGAQDDPDTGPVVVLDAKDLDRLTRTFSGPRITLHFASDDPECAVAVTDADTTLGEITKHRHVFVSQRIDPRLSQRWRWLMPRRRGACGAECVLRPRSLEALRSAFGPAWVRIGSFAGCVRDDTDCSRCDIKARLLRPWVPPVDSNEALLRLLPSTTLAEPDPQLRVMQTRAEDPAGGIEVTWEDVAALDALRWRIAAIGSDDRSEFALLRRKP